MLDAHADAPAPASPSGRVASDSGVDAIDLDNYCARKPGADEPPDGVDVIDFDQYCASKPEEADAPAPAPEYEHQTIHPSTFQMVCIVIVQMVNAADWAVILPIDVDIAGFLGMGPYYASWLVAILYLPFPFSLVFFRRLTKKSYKWSYIAWAVTVVTGNLGYVTILIWRPYGTLVWILVARVVQGMGQCITFTNKQVRAASARVCPFVLCRSREQRIDRRACLRFPLRYRSLRSQRHMTRATSTRRPSAQASRSVLLSV